MLVSLRCRAPATPMLAASSIGPVEQRPVAAVGGPVADADAGVWVDADAIRASLVVGGSRLEARR